MASKPRRIRLIPRPLVPAIDPFYRLPPNVGDVEVGEILRTRRVKVAWLGVVTQPIEAWQILYRTTTVHGEPDATITTVLIPPKHNGRLLSYQCAIDAVATKCLPSYSLQKRAHVAGSVPPFELLFMMSALRRGWVVTVPDHTGTHGHFGAPHEPGYRVLDAVRATLRLPAASLHTTSDVALLGYSGGGMATSWTVETANAYAPELAIAGAVLGSPVGDPSSAFLRLNKSFFAGLPALVVAAMRNVYPEIEQIINDDVTDVGKRKLALAERVSTVSAVLRFAFNDFDHYINQPLEQLIQDPAIQKLFADMQLGNNAPSCPLLVMQSVHDQIVSIDDIDEHVERYREHGATVEYIRDTWSDHLLLMFAGVPLMMNWIARRFEGLPVSDSTTTVRSVTRKQRGEFREMFGNLYRLSFGRPLRQRSV